MRIRCDIGWVVTLSSVVLLLSGCVRRTLTINTEPDGGLVFLNGEEVGHSPVTVDFTWYGDYDVEVHKQGFATLKSNFVTPTPWYQVPPFDFVAEVLYPGHIVDTHEASFTLEPAQPVVRDDLIARAQELQTRSRGGQSALSDESPQKVDAASPQTPEESPQNNSPTPTNEATDAPSDQAKEVPESSN